VAVIPLDYDRPVPVARQTWPRWPLIVSALAALLAFAVTLGGTFVYDDHVVVQNDPRLHDLHHLGQIWSQPYVPDGADNLWRPLVSTSYALQWAMTGGRPWPFHLVNLLLHAGVAAVVARLGQKLAGNGTGVIAGLLFALHPIHVEAVANVIGRAELACALAGLSAIVLALDRPLPIGKALLAALLCIIAALCKEQGLVLPLIFIAMLWFRRSEKNVHTLLAIITLATAGHILLRQYGMGMRFDWERSFLDYALQPLKNAQGLDRWLIPVAVIGHYLAVMAFPLHLSMDYGAAYIRPPQSLADPYLWLGFATLAGCLALAGYAMVKRHAAIGLCLVGLAITYAPVSNFYMITGDIMAERLFYLPSVFLLILLAVLLNHLPKTALLAVLLIALPAALLRTVTYAYRWNDPTVLNRLGYAERPQSAMLALFVAEDARVAGHLDQAGKLAAVACQSAPESFKVWLEAGQIARDAGNWPEAVKCFDHAADAQSGPHIASLLGEAKMHVFNDPPASRPAR